MLSLDVKTIPHDTQRYPTVGDWWQDGDTVRFRISDMGNWRYEVLVAVHEIVEFFLCRFWEIQEADVDQFDRLYEKAREGQTVAPCGCQPTETSEPGDDVHAPYGPAHRIATKIERAFALALGVDWGEYERTVETL